MNLIDKILIVLESAQPDGLGPLPYEDWLRLRNEAIAELHELHQDALRTTAHMADNPDLTW